MDNFTGMNMEQAGGRVAYADMGYGGKTQDCYAADGGVVQDGFFQDAGVLEHSPFEDEIQMDGCPDDLNQEPVEEGLDEEKSHATGNSVEDRERAEHEASEAERKAAWEAGQQAKKDAEAAQLARLDSMGDDEVAAEAMKRIGADTEKLTRRNMKDCVSEYIQTLCLEDPAFARLAMHPRKTMVNCFRYINRKAREYVEQEMKDNDIKPENGIYGSDVPDDLCYQWGEDYFRDPDAKEDQVEKEKFTPKPFAGKADSKAKQKKVEGKKGAAKKPTDEKTVNPKQEDGGQISFMDQISLGDIMAPEVKAG